MSLTADERTWLRRYKAALDEQFPGLIEELLLYGSKARGDDHLESDLDILIITPDVDRSTHHSMRWVGYMLAAMSSALPSIMVYTRTDMGALGGHRLTLCARSRAGCSTPVNQELIAAEWRRGFPRFMPRG